MVDAHVFPFLRTLLLAHKDALFAHLRERWADLFGARYGVLFHYLTSTCF